MKLRVVLDTNVLGSGLLGGAATEIIALWRSDAFDVIVSQEIMNEYERVLKRPKFKLPEWVVQELLAYVRRKAKWIEQHTELGTVVRDPSDAKFLEAAVSGHAALIVSGDGDLLDLATLEDILIISPREFLDRF